MKIFKTAVPIVALGLLTLVSCNKNKGVSTATGWEYNSSENGGFEVVEGQEQATGPGLVFVEGGTFTMGRVEQDVMFDWNNTPRRVTVSSFYMDETEVRNVDYREYLHWLRRVYKNSPQVYENAVPDTLVWRSPMGYNEPYVEYYFRHPAYNEYPVVGVSWLKANDYCLWRTDRVNERLLVEEGVLKLEWEADNEENHFDTEKYLAGLYTGTVNKNLPDLTSADGKGERPVRLEDGIILPKYRLPTEAEWEYAAYSNIGNSYDELVVEKRRFPWEGRTFRNEGRKTRGQMNANFMRGRGDNMGTAGALNDNADITAPVKAYWPNDYGLYNMAGNVSEWVLDVYRPVSSEDVDEFRPFRGNVFEKVDRNEDGTPRYDTLGRISKVPVTEKDLKVNGNTRRNYTKAYYKNYEDGDVESSVDYQNKEEFKDVKESDRMYFAGTTTLINDEVRVIKGGSWKDRAYYMSPGTRRFMNEAESSDDLGFRCAMTRVGSPTGQQ